MFLNINNKLNITFCGMMGSGKTSIGKVLAREIKFKFIDIDKLIEDSAGKSIKKIFSEDGEKYFRYLEEKITIKFLSNKKTIISLGGGAIINNNIRNSIKKNSFNIYLKVNIDTLEKRLKNSQKRPLIDSNNLKNTIINLIEKREVFYNKADLIINNETNLINTVNKIITKIRNDKENKYKNKK